MEHAKKLLHSFGVAAGTAIVMILLLSFLLKVFLPVSPAQNTWAIVAYIATWIVSVSFGGYKGIKYWRHYNEPRL
jgi:Na+-translocating ferredoxin:NAD+ oxidoreductase RnfA subunit